MSPGERATHPRVQRRHTEAEDSGHDWIIAFET